MRVSFTVTNGWKWLAVLSSLSVFAVASKAGAQTTTVLTHVTVIDGTGKEPRHDVSLLIEGERIKGLINAGAALPKKATIVDMAGKTIMPEIVNCHGHVGLLKGTKMSGANYTKDNVERQLLQYQDYGVGAVMVMGTDHDDVYQWREESHSGTLPGALIFTAGRGFGVPEGLPPVNMGADAAYRPTSAEEARKDVRELATGAHASPPNDDAKPTVSVDPEKNSNQIGIASGIQGKSAVSGSTASRPDLVKMWVDDFWGQYPKMSPEIYGAIIDEAHKQHLRVAVHVYHEEDAQKLVDLGVDVLAHSVRGRRDPGCAGG